MENDELEEVFVLGYHFPYESLTRSFSRYQPKSQTEIYKNCHLSNETDKTNKYYKLF